MSVEEYPQIKVLIVERDDEMRDQLEVLIGAYKDFSVIGSAVSGESAISTIQASHPDLVIIETDLGDMTGFEVIERVYPMHKPRIVMLSPESHGAVKAFEYFVFDYLVKPFKSERFHLTMLKLKEEFSKRDDQALQNKLNALFRYVSANQNGGKQQGAESGYHAIPIKNGSRIYFIAEEDIEFIEASGYYIEIFAKGKKHLVRESLKDIVKRLDPSCFLRVHRSAIINLRYLSEIRRSGASEFNIKMIDGSEFKISKSYKAEVFDKVGIRN